MIVYANQVQIFREDVYAVLAYGELWKKLEPTTYLVFQHATFKTLSVFYDMNKEHFQNETFYPAPPNSKATDAEKLAGLKNCVSCRGEKTVLYKIELRY